MVLSQSLPQMKSATSMLSVVHAAPASAHTASPLLFNTPTNNEASTVNMLGQVIIACSDHIGSLKHLLSSVTAIFTQTTAPADVKNINGVANDDTTNTDPSVIDFNASLIQSSGKRSGFWLSWG